MSCVRLVLAGVEHTCGYTNSLFSLQLVSCFFNSLFCGFTLLVIRLTVFYPGFFCLYPEFCFFRLSSLETELAGGWTWESAHGTALGVVVFLEGGFLLFLDCWFTVYSVDVGRGQMLDVLFFLVYE